MIKDYKLIFQGEFRRFWLKSKLEETPALKLQTAENCYPILSLPSVHCSENLSEFIENLVLNSPLDGLLFYHQDGHYMHGITPLVTWLKSFMLPEVLGVSVPPPLDEKPDGYVDMSHYLHSERRKNKEISQTCEVNVSLKLSRNNSFIYKNYKNINFFALQMDIPVMNS